MLLDDPPAADACVGAPPCPPPPPCGAPCCGADPRFRSAAVSFEHVVFAYPQRPLAPVLCGVSLSIPAGAHVALVGLSGSGKSTLVQARRSMFFLFRIIFSLFFGSFSSSLVAAVAALLRAPVRARGAEWPRRARHAPSVAALHGACVRRFCQIFFFVSFKRLTRAGRRLLRSPSSRKSRRSSRSRCATTSPTRAWFRIPNLFFLYLFVNKFELPACSRSDPAATRPPPTRRCRRRRRRRARSASSTASQTDSRPKSGTRACSCRGGKSSASARAVPLRVASSFASISRMLSIRSHRARRVAQPAAAHFRRSHVRCAPHPRSALPPRTPTQLLVSSWIHLS